jgi:hypothetical protein
LITQTTMIAASTIAQSGSKANSYILGKLAGLKERDRSLRSYWDGDFKFTISFHQGLAKNCTIRWLRTKSTCLILTPPKSRSNTAPFSCITQSRYHTEVNVLCAQHTISHKPHKARMEPHQPPPSTADGEVTGRCYRLRLWGCKEATCRHLLYSIIIKLMVNSNTIYCVAQA